MSQAETSSREAFFQPLQRPASAKRVGAKASMSNKPMSSFCIAGGSAEMPLSSVAMAVMRKSCCFVCGNMSDKIASNILKSICWLAGDKLVALGSSAFAVPSVRRAATYPPAITATKLMPDNLRKDRLLVAFVGEFILSTAAMKGAIKGVYELCALII